MKIAFRVDASRRIGTGHVMRCLTLAEALQNRGAAICFVCREHDGHLIATLREKSFSVALLPAPPSTTVIADGDYRAWLGVSPLADAEETSDALKGDHTDWLVVDHYGLDAEWEQRLRPRVGRVLVIDDLANRRHDCDVLLDQNYSAEGERRYVGAVPDRCQVLAGPRYAILKAEYVAWRHIAPARDGGVRRILVYFGGSDPHNMTGLALEALSALDLNHLEVDLVVGANNAHRAAIEALAAARMRTRVQGTRPHLADLMAQADLAIGAGGVTTWERMCLALPAVVISIAENQRPACEALSAAGLIEYLGDAGSVRATDISNAIRRLMNDPALLIALSSDSRTLVDGLGASRVADVMLGQSRADSAMQTRNALLSANRTPAGFDEFAFAWIHTCRSAEVLTLRNMPHVVSQMTSREPITDDDHRKFLGGYGGLSRYDFVLVDRRRHQYVGAFYVTHLDSLPQIGKYVGDPAYLGKGIAYKAMRSLLDYCRCQAGLCRIAAVTRRDNTANIALNHKLGFHEAGVAMGDFIMMEQELH